MRLGGCFHNAKMPPTCEIERSRSLSRSMSLKITLKPYAINENLNGPSAINWKPLIILKFKEIRGDSHHNQIMDDKGFSFITQKKLKDYCKKSLINLNLCEYEHTLTHDKILEIIN